MSDVDEVEVPVKVRGRGSRARARTTVTLLPSTTSEESLVRSGTFSLVTGLDVFSKCFLLPKSQWEKQEARALT